MQHDGDDPPRRIDARASCLMAVSTIVVQDSKTRLECGCVMSGDLCRAVRSGALEDDDGMRMSDPLGGNFFAARGHRFHGTGHIV